MEEPKRETADEELQPIMPAAVYVLVPLVGLVIIELWWPDERWLAREIAGGGALAVGAYWSAQEMWAKWKRWRDSSRKEQFSSEGHEE